MKPTVIIIATGLGARMKSGLAKALHPLAGRPMVQHVLETASDIDFEKTILILGHQADRVRKAAELYRTEIVLQEEQLSIGHGIRQVGGAIDGVSGPIVILCADTPLLTVETLNRLIELHKKSHSTVTLLTAEMADPFGYGRVIRGRSGVMALVEEKDATAVQKKIREVITGIYCFDKKFLLSSLARLGNDNAQGECCLSDAVALAQKKKLRISALLCEDPDEGMGVYSRHDLSRAERIMQVRINRRWMLEGVTMLDPDTVFIGNRVTLNRDVTLYPAVRLEGKTCIGEGSTVYPGSRVVNSAIGSGVTIKDGSMIEESTVADGASVGPFAHLRPGSVIGMRAKIGNFVEVKKSVIGEGSKVNHLSYIGDATLGKDVYIGAGVITCDYDGFEKHPTVIEDDVFVGSDAQFIASVKIGKGALIAAGATITRDVPPDAMAIGRIPQNIREGYMSRKKRMKQI